MSEKIVQSAQRKRRLPLRLVAIIIGAAAAIALVILLIAGDRNIDVASRTVADVVTEIESRGCRQVFPEIDRFSVETNADPALLNAAGVCLARDGQLSKARRAFSMAADRSEIAVRNLAKLDEFLTAREYIDALELEPEPDVPELLLSPGPTGQDAIR